MVSFNFSVYGPRNKTFGHPLVFTKREMATERKRDPVGTVKELTGFAQSKQSRIHGFQPVTVSKAILFIGRTTHSTLVISLALWDVCPSCETIGQRKKNVFNGTIKCLVCEMTPHCLLLLKIRLLYFNNDHILATNKYAPTNSSKTKHKLAVKTKQTRQYTSRQS